MTKKKVRFAFASLCFMAAVLVGTLMPAQQAEATGDKCLWCLYENRCIVDRVGGDNCSIVCIGGWCECQEIGVCYDWDPTT